MEYKDYYKILGVDKIADEKEIRRAYRKLAREFHPDVNPDNPRAEEKFKEINEAYQTLSDPQKRRQYDQLGSGWQRWQRSGRGAGFDDYARQWASGFSGGGQHVDLNDVFRGDGSLNDLLGALFGGLGGRATGRRPGRRAARPQRGRDLEQPVEITLEEAFHGTRRLVTKDGRRLNVKIPAGVRSGARIRIAGEGASRGGSMPSGDLYLKVSVLPHALFEREGDDLHLRMDIDLYTAILGGELRVPTLDGTVTLKIPAETQSGQTFRLRGKGMPRLKKPSQRGDLYVKVQVQLPKKLSQREKELFGQLAGMRSH